MTEAEIVQLWGDFAFEFNSIGVLVMVLLYQIGQRAYITALILLLLITLGVSDTWEEMQPRMDEIMEVLEELSL